jgi:enterochelin esterase-like enzyme
MLEWVLTRHIDDDRFIAIVCLAALAALVIATVRPPFARRLSVGLAAGAGSALIGLVVVWLVSDVFDAFGIGLSATTWAWCAGAFAGVGIAVAGMWRTRWWRVVVAAAGIPMVLIAAAAGINQDYGAYSTIQDALGLTHYRTVTGNALQAGADPHTAADVSSWRPPAGMPQRGIVEQVQIPATVSHFPARPAIVYLPPAARTAHPPALPVVMAMAGQPGSPPEMTGMGGMAADLDAYAAKHKGLAPIVVSPDQLGQPENNPMCVDSKLGNSATYLTVDVPRWVRAHLAVTSGDWAVAGFSQGATCAVQFASEHPDLFGTFITVASEVGPKSGSIASTIAKGFGGSRSAYEAALPVDIMAKNAPYRHSTAIFGVGQNDPHFRAYARLLAAAATRAGMRVQTIVSPGTAHDWYTVRYVLAHALPEVSDAWGLDR